MLTCPNNQEWDLAVCSSVAQWTECQPANQRVEGSTPSLGHMPGLQARPRKATTHSLLLFFPSLKIIKSFLKKVFKELNVYGYRSWVLAKIYQIFFFKILFLERGKEGREGGRETSMCQRNIHWLPLAPPQLGTWPATQACALNSNRTGDLLVYNMTPIPLSHTSQLYFLICSTLKLLNEQVCILLTMYKALCK